MLIETKLMVGGRQFVDIQTYFGHVSLQGREPQPLCLTYYKAAVGEHACVRCMCIYVGRRHAYSILTALMQVGAPNLSWRVDGKRTYTNIWTNDAAE